MPFLVTGDMILKLAPAMYFCCKGSSETVFTEAVKLHAEITIVSRNLLYFVQYIQPRYCKNHGVLPFMVLNKCDDNIRKNFLHEKRIYLDYSNVLTMD